jgi:putative endonuclease
MFYVYVLKSENTKKNFYIGYTSDLKRRIVEHGCGNTRTTKGKNPKLIYYEAFESKALAENREKGLKTSGSVYNALIKRLGLK